MTAVYQAINAVSQELASVGISKDRKNQQQGYSFRGIDEVMNALAPLLAKHRLIIVPRMISREQAERVSKSGSAVFYTTVHAEFDFVSAVDGSKHTASTFGEGMDNADKSTNKAMSAAYKYAAFLTFCIPTEGGGDIDPDAITPDPVEPAPTTQRKPADPAPAAPSHRPISDRARAQAAKPEPVKRQSAVDVSTQLCNAMMGEIAGIQSPADLQRWMDAARERASRLTQADRAALRKACEFRRESLAVAA